MQQTWHKNNVVNYEGLYNSLRLRTVKLMSSVRMFSSEETNLLSSESTSGGGIAEIGNNNIN